MPRQAKSNRPGLEATILQCSARTQHACAHARGVLEVIFSCQCLLEPAFFPSLETRHTHTRWPTLVEGATWGDERPEALALAPVPLPAVHGAVGVAVLPRPVPLLVHQFSLEHLKTEETKVEWSGRSRVEGRLASKGQTGPSRTKNTFLQKY